MTDQATPNLPSRDFGETSAFYRNLGFTEVWRDEHWMVLAQGSITLEFFPHPGLEPKDSWFGSCLRLDDLDAFYDKCRDMGLPETTTGFPRLHPPKTGEYRGKMASLIDIDGSLLRLIQN